MNLNDRIRAYLAHVPGAVAGQGGHSATFKLACRLYNGFGCSEEETYRWLLEWNQSCTPPWSEKELLHKAKEAAKAPPKEPRGQLLGGARNGRRTRCAAVVIRKLPEPIKPTVIWRGRLEPLKTADAMKQSRAVATDATDETQSLVVGSRTLQSTGGGVMPRGGSEISVASVAGSEEPLVLAVIEMFGAKIVMDNGSQSRLAEDRRQVQ